MALRGQRKGSPGEALRRHFLKPWLASSHPSRLPFGVLPYPVQGSGKLPHGVMKCLLPLSAWRLIPGGDRLGHLPEPGKHIFGLIQHDLQLLLSPGNCPGNGRQGVAGDIEGQKAEECIRGPPAEISVQLSSGKGRARLGTPDDAVELLPGVSLIESVKIQDADAFFLVYDHVPRMVVAMLETLRTVFQEVAVRFQVIQDEGVSGKIHAAGPVGADLHVHFPAETNRPVFRT